MSAGAPCRFAVTEARRTTVSWSPGGTDPSTRWNGPVPQRPMVVEYRGHAGTLNVAPASGPGVFCWSGTPAEVEGVGVTGCTLGGRVAGTGPGAPSGRPRSCQDTAATSRMPSVAVATP